MFAKVNQQGHELPRHHLSTTLVGLGIPALFTLVAVLLINSWRSELPELIAQHWGTDGPDGFGTVTAQLVTLVVTVGLLSLMFWGGAWFMRSGRRALVGSSVGVATFLAGLFVALVHSQRGLIDAADAPDISWEVFGTLMLGLVAGIVAAVLLPADGPLVTEKPLPRGAAVAKLRPTDSRELNTVVSSRGLIIMGAASVLLTGLIAIVAKIPALLAVALLVGLTFTVSYFKVRISAAGFDARSFLGWPRQQIPLSEIVSASTTTVDPLNDFGGWGWRTGFKDDSVGIVTRKGQALKVQRTGGRTVVVTLEKPEQAAELINALIQEERGSE